MSHDDLLQRISINPEICFGKPVSKVGHVAETKWAALARRYRERPNLQGNSEKLNALVREFREEFSL